MASSNFWEGLISGQTTAGQTEPLVSWIGREPSVERKRRVKNGLESNTLVGHPSLGLWLQLHLSLRELGVIGLTP